MTGSTRVRSLLGTFVAVAAEHPDGEAAAQAAVGRAFDDLARVQRQMHPSQPGSDLARLHEAAVGVPLAVDPWTAECLDLALQFFRDSAGRFDAVLPGTGGSSRDIERCAGVVTRHAPLHIDLGGIAKGYAVDRAVDRLRALGCSNGVVNAGGDLRAFGEPTLVHIRMAGRTLPYWLQDGALAVSDPTLVTAPAEHRGYYRDGRPLDAPVAIAIAARDAVSADALTKILDDAEVPEDLAGLVARTSARVVACYRG
jgi:thiamine biosynthesis lipoprotein